MLTVLAAIFFLLLLSAFFSGSETALTAASHPTMHQLAHDGNERAAMVNKLHERKNRLISTILLGNNLVNILASALATSVLIQMFGEAGIAYATIAMTVLVLVFAEILPKTYAFENANRMALAIAPAARLLVFLLYPFTQAINGVIWCLFKILRRDFDSSTAFGKGDEELRGAIELHDRDDADVKAERDMLRSVLDLAEVQVGEVMTHRKNVSTLDASLPSRDIISAVLESPFTRIPLWQDDPDNIVGVLHAKALLRALYSDDSNDTDTIDILALSADPWFVPETTTLDDQLEAFRERHAHSALVVDEYGVLMGLVTLEDILEEIVGDIEDEHDVTVSGVRKQAGGSYVVEGTVTIRDLNRETEWNLPDGEASTVAGLILHESRRIPEVGQAFMFHTFRFEILQRHRNQITSVRITPPEDTQIL